MRRLFIVSCLALCAAGSAFADPVQDALAAGDYPAALTAIDARLRSQPQDPEALFLKGLVLSLSEQLDEAAMLFRRLVRSHPQYPEPANNLAVIQARQGDLEGALNTLRNLIDQHPQYMPAHENLGDVLTAAAQNAYQRASQMGAGHETLMRKLRILESLNALPAERRASAEQGAEDAARTSPTPRPVVIEATVAPVLPPPSETQFTEDQISADLLATIETWRRAWEAGDIAAYLAAYGADFEPGRGLTRAQWEGDRRAKVSPERGAQIRIRNLRVERRGDARVLVDFTQDYSAAHYADSVRKRLVLARADDQWVILREVVLP